MHRRTTIAGLPLLALLIGAVAPAAAAPPEDGPQPCRIERDARGEENMALDGRFETVTSVDLDAQGRVEREVTTSAFAGQVQIRRRSYTRDERGRVTREQHQFVVFEGDTSAGVPREAVRRVEDFDICSVTTFTYDAAGHVLTEDLDDGCTGTDDWRTRFTYDDHGRVTLLQDLIRISTGKVGFQRRYTYGADGTLELEEVGNAGDGTWPLQIRHEHDAAGRVIRKTRDWADSEMVDEVEEFTYDADGRLTNHTVFHPPGTEFKSTVYAYDDAGRLVVEDERLGAHHAHTAHVVYTYECR